MAQLARTFTTLLVTLFLPATAPAQGSTISTAKILEALALASGGTVCEIGAGDGALSIAASEIVGGRGHVYTSELGSERVKALQAKVSAAERPQIHVMAGEAERTNFPDGACDALFMRNVYHHFAAPAAMNASIATAVKPGGRLAVVDFTPPDSEASRPADRAKDGTHGVRAETVTRELRQAGFEVVATEAGPSEGPGSDRWFMVVAVKRGT